MDILSSRLAQNNGSLAKEIKNILDEAQDLGAVVGVQRMELICEQYDKLSPDVAYQWLDLDGFQYEIEEAQTHSRRVEIIHFIRNVLSLAPLIATWIALFSAVDAYQKNLTVHSNDQYIPFLQQWQDGFHGLTWFTFTAAAGIDALLLFLYLVSILVGHEMERKAQYVATEFVHRLRATTGKLIEAVAAANISPIRTPADIDKVTIAIKKVIDSAMDANKQLAQTTEQSIQSIVQTVTPILTRFDQTTTDLHTQFTTFQTQLTDLTNSTKQLSSDVALMARHAQSYVTIGQDINTHMTTLSQAEQGMVTQLTNLSGGFNSALNGLSGATTGLQQATTSVTSATQALDNGIKLTTTQLTDSVARATAFQAELANFHTQLTDLSQTIQQIVGASATLATNSQNYVTVGQSIDQQIAHLDGTEQQVLGQLQSIVGSVTTASNNMAQATSGIQQAASGVGSIANGLTSGVKTTVGQMTSNVNRATASLGQVENQLAATSAMLYQVTQQLASLQLAQSNTGGGGLLGWMMQRGAQQPRARGTRRARP